jgi:hypothetical protein
MVKKRDSNLLFNEKNPRNTPELEARIFKSVKGTLRAKRPESEGFSLSVFIKPLLKYSLVGASLGVAAVFYTVLKRQEKPDLDIKPLAKKDVSTPSPAEIISETHLKLAKKEVIASEIDFEILADLDRLQNFGIVSDLDVIEKWDDSNV